MIDAVLGSTILFLILNLLAGLWRVRRGPSAADRMLAALLFASTIVAILLVLAELTDDPPLRTVALLFVLLATIVTLAFVNQPEGAAGPPAASPPQDASDATEPAGSARPRDDTFGQARAAGGARPTGDADARPTADGSSA